MFNGLGGFAPLYDPSSFLHEMFSRVAVFGTYAETGSRPQSELRFTANNCVVTSIDIRSVEPVDQKTRDSLQQSVTLAIEITTQSQVSA